MRSAVTIALTPPADKPNGRNRPDGEVTRRKKEAQDRLAPKQGTLSFEDDLQEMKPKFPAGEEPRETLAVMRVLEAAAGAGEHRGDCAAFRARQTD